jgi:hypothetical protein
MRLVRDGDERRGLGELFGAADAPQDADCGQAVLGCADDVELPVSDHDRSALGCEVPERSLDRGALGLVLGRQIWSDDGVEQVSKVEGLEDQAEAMLDNRPLRPPRPGRWDQAGDRRARLAPGRAREGLAVAGGGGGGGGLPGSNGTQQLLLRIAADTEELEGTTSAAGRSSASGGERMLLRAWDGETRPWSVGELRPHFPDSPGGPRWIWAPRPPNCRTSRDNREMPNHPQAPTYT